jgi:hypothetical protein
VIGNALIVEKRLLNFLSNLIPTGQFIAETAGLSEELLGDKK